MPEIGTSSSMSGDGKRSAGHRPQATAPILDSTEGVVVDRAPLRLESEHRNQNGASLTPCEPIRQHIEIANSDVLRALPGQSDPSSDAGILDARIGAAATRYSDRQPGATGELSNMWQLSGGHPNKCGFAIAPPARELR